MNALDASENAYKNGYNKGYAEATERINVVLSKLNIENPYTGEKVSTLEEVEQVLGKIDGKEKGEE